MSQVLLAVENILQSSNIFNRSRETALCMHFGDKKVTQFSGFLPTSMSYLKSISPPHLTKNTEKISERLFLLVPKLMIFYFSFSQHVKKTNVS